MRYVTCLTLLLIPFQGLFAQGAGDALFDTDQVIEIRLTFADEDFWVTLSVDHATGGNLLIPADMQVTDLTGTYQLPNVGIRLKGNSSFDHYPTSKKPIKIDFNEFVQGQDYHGLKKLNLNNSWSDPTQIREKLFFDICREHGVLAPRVVFANVFLNDIPWGFYSVVEQVDKTFLDRWLGDNKGNLFKSGDNYTPNGAGLGLEADLRHYGNSASNYTGRYDLKTNETENDWTDFIALLALIDNSSTSELVNELPQRMVLSEALRSLALDNLYGNMDAYYGSARNYYLYHDSTSFKWNWIKWDANMSFGRYVPQWIDDPATLPATYTTPGRRLLQRVLQTPALRTAYLNEFCEVFSDFSNEELDTRIDALADFIRPHVAADPNKEFSTALFDLNMQQTITAQSGNIWHTAPGLKSFIAQRRAFLMASSLDCTTAGIADLVAGTLGVYPNPTTGPVTISSPAGSDQRSIEVSDALGRRVVVPIANEQVDLSGLPAGNYTLSLDLPEGPLRAMVIKQ